MENSNSTTSKRKVVIICGPTGVGKTAFAIKLAMKFGAEIINSDSMQIYKYMDIGTAKPTSYELSLIPHSLIDIVTPDQPFDAAMFADRAAQEEEKLSIKGKNVFIVGGTGLYIKAFLNGLFRSDPADSIALEKLRAEAELVGAAILHERLKDIDQAASEKIHPNDIFRITRALEHYEKTGSPISESWKNHGFRESRYEYLKICLGMDRADLYERINRRVEIMIQEDFPAEVRKLFDMGYTRDLKPMKSIGYRHMCEFLSGEVNFDRCVELLKQDTRHYAKRQLTWFRHETDAIWLDPTETDKASELISRFLDISKNCLFEH